MLAIANLSACDSFAPTSSCGAFPSGRPVAAILPRGGSLSAWSCLGQFNGQSPHPNRAGEAVTMPVTGPGIFRVRQEDTEHGRGKTRHDKPAR